MGTAGHRGILVAIEGIDGAGKTTQVCRLVRVLELAGIPHLATKEPTNGEWGRKIRESAKSGRMSAEDELDAFIRDRREHVENELQPALDRGLVVIVDRYYLSTVAYQGARGLDSQRLLALNSFAPAPDVLVVLDIDPKLGLQRIRQRGDDADLFEKEEELRRAREIFCRLPVPNLHLLDATESVKALTHKVVNLVVEAYRARPGHANRADGMHADDLADAIDALDESPPAFGTLA